MKPIINKSFAATLAATVLTCISIANAQDATPAAPGNGGNRRGNFNPEEFRQRMDDRLKTALKVTDDEWAVIKPLVDKVNTVRASGGGFGGFGGRGGRGGGGGGAAGGATTTAGQPAPGGGNRGGSPESQALRTALESESTTPDEIKAKLAAVRDARKKNAAALEAARTDLRKVLTLRQEAVLVSMGMLD
jgi:Spy/CpxP family protein refolding chaperone